MSLITQGSNHVFICGITRSGKTSFAHKAISEIKRPAVYFNIQGESVPVDFIDVYSGDVSVFQIMDALKDGAKINLIFTDWRKGYKVTAGYVINQLMDAGFSDEKPVYIVIDECHLLDGFSLEMARYAATAGLKKGVRIIFISQRPALVDKTLYTQSFEHYLFYLQQSEREYLKGKGIDYERCKAEWERRGAYSYVCFDGYDYMGRGAISV